MEPLTVEELLAIERSTNFAIAEKPLIGRLEFIKNGEFDDKEAVLLVDLNTQQSIHCNVDLMRPEALNDIVIIENWNYIYCELDSIQFLEFRLLDAFRTSKQEQSILHQCLAFDKQVFEDYLEKNKKFYTPEDDTLVTKEAAVHIVGKVISVSKVFTRLDLPTTFFVQLASKNETAPSLTIMFRADDLIEYYHLFQIGFLYAFNDMTQSFAFEIQESPNSLFEYHQGISSIQMITPNQYEKALIDSGQTVSRAKKYGHENTTIEVFIVRVIDVLLGVYEVNNGKIICLFKCHKYNAVRPFRVSTKLRLHRVHQISVKAYKDHASNLFENLWGSSSYQSIDGHKIYSVLVACPRSDLQVLSFPTHCDIVQTIHQWISTEHLVDLYTEIIHLHILDIFRLLEIYTPLIIHFGDVPGLSEIKNKLTDFLAGDIDINKRVKETQSFIIQFLNDDIRCTTVDRPNAEHYYQQTLLNMNHCLPISMAVDYLFKNAKQVETSQSIGGYYSIDRPDIYTLISQLDEGFRCPAFGLLLTAEDGKIYLNDEKTKIRLKVIGLSEMSVSDGLYLLKKLHWIKEDLSYVVSSKKYTLYQEYLCCHINNLVLIHGPEQPQLSFFCRPILSSISVSHFFASKVYASALRNGVYHTMYVNTISPSKIFSAGVHPFCMRSVLDVTIYTINGNQNFKKDVIIELDSSKGGLKYRNMIHPLKWYVIEGPVDQSQMTFDSSIHKIYPIYNQRDPWVNVSNIIEFDYAQKNTGAFRNSKKTVSISELTSPKTRYSKYDNEKDRTIDVDGIVVSKSFVQEKKTNSTRALSDFKKFGVGTGCDTQKLVVRIRQRNTLEIIDIYFVSKNTEYFLGLLVGTFVKFKSLLRPSGFSPTGKRYLMCNEWTTAEIEDIGIAKEIAPTAPYPTNSLILHLYNNEVEEFLPNIIRVTCSIRSFQSLSVKFVCVFCKSVAIEGVCPESCLESKKICLASAVIEICDGTGIAQAFVDGERNLFTLLQLNEKQKKNLKRVAFEEGQVFFSDRQTGFYEREEEYENNEKSEEENNVDVEPEGPNQYQMLRYMCHQAQKPQVCLYGSLVKPKASQTLGDDSIASKLNLFPLRIRNGENVLNTFVRKKPTLRVIEVEKTDAAAEAWKFFQ